MSIAEVISQTVGSTDSKRRVLVRQAEGLPRLSATVTAHAGARRHGVEPGMLPRERLVLCLLQTTFALKLCQCRSRADS